jgi:beta-N-acetylglucosaminidase
MDYVSKGREIKMKKKLNLNKLAIALLTILVIGTSFTTVYMYNKLTDKINVSESKLIEANKKINEYGNTINELEKNLSTSGEENVKLQEKVKELESTNESLMGENKELKEFNDKILSLPKWDSRNVTSASNVSEVGLQLALKDTGLEGLESSFIKAEETYGINAIFLTSLIAQESGWGTSRRAREQNNLSGYAVYGDTAKGRTFSSKSESIMETAELLKKHYVGKGLYDINSINNKYSADNNWDSKIHSIANKLVTKANVNNYIGL